MQDVKKPEQDEVVTADSLDADLGPDGTLAAGTMPILGLSPLESKAQTSAEAEMDRVTTLQLALISLN